jgi:hypothetical protein
MPLKLLMAKGFGFVQQALTRRRALMLGMGTLTGVAKLRSSLII